VCIAWERVLSGQMSANDGSRVASLFRQTDYLTSREFSVVHKIVLGIVYSDLATQLDASTAEINAKDSRGRTPLSWASGRGDDQAVAMLLKYGANPNVTDTCQQSPLHYAQNTACAQLLLHHGADLHALNQESQTPLYTACRNVWSSSLVTYLIEAGSEIDATDHTDQTALHASIGNGKHMPYINVLVSKGANINARNNSSDTPLRFAMIYNMHDLIIQMLKTGNADFAGVNNYGQSFAHAIAQTADVETVKLLTMAKPGSLKLDLGMKDKSGKTPFEYFEERRAFMDEGQARELREGFDGLVRALTGGEAEEGTATFDGVKSEIVVRIAEVEDDELIEETGEWDVWHDAVESF
jgi:ankyrin repeat protein